MMNIILSLILGLWFLVVLGFYTYIAGAVLARMLADLKHVAIVLTGLNRRRPHLLTSPERWRLVLMVLTGGLVVLAASFAWMASSLLQYCGLAVVASAPMFWLLLRHMRD